MKCYKKKPKFCHLWQLICKVGGLIHCRAYLFEIQRARFFFPSFYFLHWLYKRKNGQGAKFDSLFQQRMRVDGRSAQTVGKKMKALRHAICKSWYLKTVQQFAPLMQQRLASWWAGQVCIRLNYSVFKVNLVYTNTQELCYLKVFSELRGFWNPEPSNLDIYLLISKGFLGRLQITENVDCESRGRHLDSELHWSSLWGWVSISDKLPRQEIHIKKANKIEDVQRKKRVLQWELQAWAMIFALVSRTVLFAASPTPLPLFLPTGVLITTSFSSPFVMMLSCLSNAACS